MSAAAQLFDWDQSALQTSRISETDARSDRNWFLANPRRRYRARYGGNGRVWIVRRRPGMMLLRTSANIAQQLPDTDAALREAWVHSAWRELSDPERKALINQIKIQEPRR
jgi:hypothetical protein